MKHALLIIALVLASLTLRAEHSYTLHNALAGDHDHHYVASSHILLSPGFLAEPIGSHSVNLEINPFEVTPPSIGLTGGPLPNQDGVVGSLVGNVNVGELGAATYAIPISLPQGLGGMKPSLSINYNSQARNGLLGWGWDLCGISSITRAGGTYYHDGYLSAVNYADDRFLLDGQRLLKVSDGTYGSHIVSYRTELDQMNKIISYEESEISGPSYFKIWTADGHIVYYGNTEDSKALRNSQNYINVWLLSSIEDRYGNRMDYHYHLEADSYQLASITYSENGNIGPAFTVVFQYDTRDDVEIGFAGNCLFLRKDLLTGISILNGNQELAFYQFSYHKPNPQNGYPYHRLKEIQLSAGTEHFNPTTITWGANSFSNLSASNLKLNVTTTGINNAFINAVKFSGDFNGDGFTDVIATRPNSYGEYTTAEVYLNRGVVGSLQFDLVHTFPFNPNISWIYVGDFDGNGWDDILFANRTRYGSPLPDVISADIYLCKECATLPVDFIPYHTPTFTVPNDLVEALLVGDYSGQGKCDILVQTAAEGGTVPTASILYSYDLESDVFPPLYFGDHLESNRFYPADYNGDGITDLLYKKSDGTTHIAQLKRNGDVCHFEEATALPPIQWEDCFPGDFNGDGMTDVLFFQSGNSQPWKIFLSSPLGFSLMAFALPSSFPYHDPGDYLFSLDQPHHSSHYIKVGDFDGNGCADIALYHDQKFHVYYGPVNWTTSGSPFAGSQQINIQAFNLYDNMNVCLGNFLGQESLSFLGNNTLSHLPPMTHRHEVKRITDGFARHTEFQYDYLVPNPRNPSENDFYHLQSTLTDPDHGIYAISLPIRALKKLTTYNVNDKPVETYCYYNGALLHRLGKGFLGFSETRQEDYCNQLLQKKTIRQYDIPSLAGAFHVMISEETVYDNEGQLMAKSSYSNRLFNHLRNNKVIIPIADKTMEEYDIDHPGVLLKKEIQNTTFNTHCSSVYQYNDLLSLTSEVKGRTSHSNIVSASFCEFQETVSTTYASDITNSWIINRPSCITTIFHHEGDPHDVCRQKTFTYNSLKPFQIKTVTETPNDGSNPHDRLTLKTTYLYDAVGNIKSQTKSTPYDDTESRRELFEYSGSYGCRLLTKHTNALGQETLYSYDPVYNYCQSVTDCNGLTTFFVQDPLGVTRRTTYPDGTVAHEVLRWEDGGFIHWEKKTGQPTKITKYAPTMEVIQNKSYDLQGDLLLSSITYDNYGQISHKSQPHRLGEPAPSIQYCYDIHHRINDIRHEDGVHETIQSEGYCNTSTYYALDGSTQTESKTLNIMGWTIRSTDADGTTIVYDYYADGKPKSSQIEGHDETRITMSYDGLGNRITINDPNYGLTTNEFNAYGELIRRVSPKSDITVYSYNALGNPLQRIESSNRENRSETTTWLYGTEKGEWGLLKRITSANQTITYEYDDLLRLKSTNEQCLGEDYLTHYAYDQGSRVSSITYPTNYTVTYDYTSEGYLQNVMGNGSVLLWKTLRTNTLGQPTKVITGDGLSTLYEYDENMQRILSLRTERDNTCIQHFIYEYDHYANMTRRSDITRSQEEHFGYDRLNRLTSVSDAQGESLFTYDPLGRMTGKTTPEGVQFSNANYSGPKPHAIKSAQTRNGVFAVNRMTISYTPFDKVETIVADGRQVTFDYGYDHQRIRSTTEIDGKTIGKTYVNSCEFIQQAGVPSIARTFISGPAGVFAVAETVNGKTTLHYIHKDHLGSWTTITDEEGHIEQENRFDAWGNCLHEDDLMFDRGFTGHEHIKGFGLINMNGRLYDPVTSSMLSPDNNIQMPDFTQNLNRYAYCFNNPLTYTDPDGNTVIEGALLFYIIYCTDLGYEMQKHLSPIAIHFDLHLSSQQCGIGFDVSFGVPKSYPVSYRCHCGATYYWSFFDDSYHGWEFRVGGEWCFFGFIEYSGTIFIQQGRQQTTNAIILGNWMGDVVYENDYMFNLGKYFVGVPTCDNGDRYRSAAARIRFGPIYVGCNLFTGDPGLDHKDRRTMNDPDANGRETYVLNDKGDDPNQYRAGIAYVGIGPFRYGVNSEKVRNSLQNRFAHDFLCQGDSPYFKVLDRPCQSYFYFGTGTGNTLW